MTPFASGCWQDRPTSRRGLFTLAGIGTVSLLTACGGDGPTSSTAGTASPSGAGARPAMTVSKDVSCGCCNGWVDHMRNNGFAITTEHPDNLATVWTEHDIPLDLQSCHPDRSRRHRGRARPRPPRPRVPGRPAVRVARAEPGSTDEVSMT